LVAGYAVGKSHFVCAAAMPPKASMAAPANRVIFLYMEIPSGKKGGEFF
jgi:hypothetical protein